MFDLNIKNADELQNERTAIERDGMVVSRFQALAALDDAGLLDDAELAVMDSDTRTQIAWAEAGEFRRTSPTIATLADALGLSDNDVDNLFRVAANIEA